MGLIENLLNLFSASKPVITQVGKAAATHLSKNAKKYAAGGAIVATGSITYAMGKSKGHTEGKKEGTAEQAQRDEAKFRKQHEDHEKDRAKWKKQRDAYEDLLNDIEG